MRILMVTTHFHPTVGGAERQAQALGRELIARGHSVRVLTGRVAGRPAVETIDGMPVHRAIRTAGTGAAYGAGYSLSLAAALLGWRRHYDVIHVHVLLLDAAVSGFLRRWLARPALAKAACGGPFGDVARLGRLRPRPFFVGGMRRLDTIVAPSREVEEELLASPLAEVSMVRIPNGVDTDRFRPPDDRPTVRRRLDVVGPLVLFVGRLDRQKGLTALLEAWSRVRSRVPSATLCLVGRGPQESELHALSRQLGLGSSVVFRGERPDVLPHLQAADVFVLPSLYEGMSNSLLEAMAAGRPCVVTRIGGSVELVRHGESGLVVEPGDVNRLADALVALLEDRDLADRMGRAARRTVEDGFSIGSLAGRYLGLYAELLESRPRAHATQA